MLRPHLYQLFLWQMHAVFFSIVPAVLVPLWISSESFVFMFAEIVWITAALFFIFFWLPVKYAKLACRVSVPTAELNLNYGVLYNRTKTMPLSAVQNVKVISGPLQRLCGLCSIEIRAAGSSIRMVGLKVSTAQQLLPLLLAGGAH